MKREIDLGRDLQAMGRRMVEEGQTTSQRLHDWKRVARIPRSGNTCPDCDGDGKIDGQPCTLCGGSGNGGRVEGQDRTDRQQDQQAARMSAEWAQVRRQLEALTARAVWLMDQAKANHRPLDKHRTPAQVEADGWCGNHWGRIGELVPITCRPSGEPYYKGLCRACGSWPDGLPPAEVLTAWRLGKGVKVKAS